MPTSNGDRCEIVYENFSSFEGLMAKSTNQKNLWKIGINLSVAYKPRRNFTLAHEIGHFIAHRYKRDVFQCTTGALNGLEVAAFELEANEFAADLLMPADEFRLIANSEKFTHENVSQISEKFGVSRAAAAYRWIKLSNRAIAFVIARDGMICSGRASDKLFRAGCYIKSGEEVPVLSNVSLTPGQLRTGKGTSRSWHAFYDCDQSEYATEVGDYVYIYLDFGF